MASRTSSAGVALVLAAALPGAALAAEPPAHLEGRRLRSAAVYVGTVTAVRRLGALDGLAGETQGRMEATVKVARALRTPPGASVPEEAPVRFDSRVPEPEGDGFYALVPGEAVLVFADGFEPAYPRELMHGTPAALTSQIKDLRDYVIAMDAAAMSLHGLTAATKAGQVKLYDAALDAVARLGTNR